VESVPLLLLYAFMLWAEATLPFIVMLLFNYNLRLLKFLSHIILELPVVTSVIMFGHYKHIYELSIKYNSVYIFIFFTRVST
jgi:hypothetical protein